LCYLLRLTRVSKALPSEAEGTQGRRGRIPERVS